MEQSRLPPHPDFFTSPANSPCIVEDTATHSYGEVQAATSTICDLLQQRGVVPNAIVALHTNQDVASIVALLALLELGCTVLLTHSRWPQPMLTEAVERVKASYCVTGQGNSVSPILPDITVEPTRQMESQPAWATGPAVIVATSGSTGIPKLALLPLSALLVSARTTACACALSADDCWHLSLPLYHVGGLGVLLRTLVTGSSLSLAHPFEANARAHTTHLSLVPTQLYRALKDPVSREALRRQKVIMLGGAPIGSRIVSEAVALGIPIVTTYGLTEMGSAVTLASSHLLSDGGAVSLGHPLPQRELKLAPDGEVLVRGETLFRGYITREGLSLPSSEEHGWFPTGDIGQLLPDGALTILGRRDAQFISGGENIHPEMIENALTSLPGIVAACVVPIEDEEFGCRPYAFVVSESASLDINQIRDALRSRIPGFAVPVGMQEAPQEMLTPTGKFNRAQARRAVRGVGG